MEVRVRAFGPCRGLFPEDAFALRLRAGSTASELLEVLRSRAAAPGIPQGIALAVNREVAAPDRELRSGDEVALIPPVSGG